MKKQSGVVWGGIYFSGVFKFGPEYICKIVHEHERVDMSCNHTHFTHKATEAGQFCECSPVNRGDCVAAQVPSKI